MSSITWMLQLGTASQQADLCVWQTLQEKFDKHPEVTHSKVELERLLDELDRYKTFFDLGEREVLSQENMELRNHLQTYLECDTPGPAKNRRLSLTSKAIRESAADLSLLRTAVPDGASLCGEDLETDQLVNERMLWQERELEWLTLMEEMAAESEKWRLLADKRKVELDGEKRYVMTCSAPRVRIRLLWLLWSSVLKYLPLSRCWELVHHYNPSL